MVFVSVVHDQIPGSMIVCAPVPFLGEVSINKAVVGRLIG